MILTRINMQLTIKYLRKEIDVYDQRNLITWATFWHSLGAKIPPAVYKPLRVQLWQRTLNRQATRSTEALKPSWTSSSTTNLNQTSYFFFHKYFFSSSYATNLSISICISDWIGFNCCWICKSAVRPSKAQAKNQ